MLAKIAVVVLIAVAASDAYVQQTVSAVLDDVRAATGTHSTTAPQFLAEGKAGPIGWDACQRISVSISTQNLSAQRRQAVDVAVGQLAAATGLPLHVGQLVPDAPTRAWLRTRARRTGTGSTAPVLIGFVERERTDLLAPGAAGEATMSVTGEHVVAAAVAIDVDQVGRDELLPIVLHELGHVVGLGHSSDRRQVMHSVVPSGAVGYGVQDLRGLARLGRPCPAQS